ncbi:MAG: methyltransferase domain-containing protein [Candidatus Omnitrophica bacterium]|nr:methyltransferase domain-containing protein [Candidatus Omnitrophota bacterium]
MMSERDGYELFRLKRSYREGKNICQLLRKNGKNTEHAIEVSYDLQSGAYIAALEHNPERARQKAAYTADVAGVINSLCKPASVLEAGIGEATTLQGVIKHMDARVKMYGFDISWSRVAYAREWLRKKKVRHNVVLCTGSLLHIPCADNSVDVVYTSHSIEPNGGNEEPIIRELYRVTRKYLILLEPGYELAAADARKRMKLHGYCRGLKKICESLGYRVVIHRLFQSPPADPLNPTAITVIKKDAKQRSGNVLACPRLKTPLEEIGGALYSPKALTVYPILLGIPCLRVENGIIASAYPRIRTIRADKRKQGRRTSW